jgi:hypothetical protein
VRRWKEEFGREELQKADRIPQTRDKCTRTVSTLWDRNRCRISKTGESSRK